MKPQNIKTRIHRTPSWNGCSMMLPILRLWLTRCFRYFFFCVCVCVCVCVSLFAVALNIHKKKKKKTGIYFFFALLSLALSLTSLLKMDKKVLEIAVLSFWMETAERRIKSAAKAHDYRLCEKLQKRFESWQKQISEIDPQGHPVKKIYILYYTY